MESEKLEPIQGSQYFRIPLESLVGNPYQPRRFFDKRSLRALAESIKKLGQLEDILVRPLGDKFQIVLGERRWKACQLAGLPTVNGKIRELNDEETFLISLTENVQRENLTDVEEAFAFKSYLDRGMSQQDVGSLLGKLDHRVAEKLKLLGSRFYIEYLEQNLASAEKEIERLKQENRLIRGAQDPEP
ncbi:MAG: ParB/RepB/Spo0J family partition protein [Desulfobacterales bacterium]|nr:ParB/RepB/Spo0J family partition protein [Desulfobacterales bacterium]